MSSLSEAKDTNPPNAFDIAAGRYDSDAASNPMMVWLRRESLRPLTRCFREGDMLLEVGCGTGEEAIALARRGMRVVATDASAGMVAALNVKMKSDPLLRSRITSKVLPAERLDILIEEYSPSSFDGAYSSLGPLNCVSNLEEVAFALATLVRPGGRLQISMLNKYCLWETAWYLVALRPKLAFRRWKGKASGTALAGGATLDVYYWPVRHIERTFERAGFRVRTRRSLPWALPPTYAAHVLKGRPQLLGALNRIERRTAHLWPFYILGDHIHFDMVRLKK